MKIEEKAKAYDEALKYAMIYYKNGNEGMKVMMKTCFPVLAEESKDERIRKAIIHFISHTPTVPKGIIGKKTMLAWLEKQDKNNMGISEATKKKLEDNLNKALEKETPESWNEFLEKQGEQKSFARHKVGDTIYYDSFGRLVSFVIANIVEDGTNNPMYEDKDGNSVFQNDIVEQKPTEWHREDEQNLNACLGYIPDEYLRKWLNDVIHVKYDKLAEWSEGDEVILDGIIEDIEVLKEEEGNKDVKAAYQREIDWLKSLKERVQPKPQQEWSEEDKNMLQSILDEYKSMPIEKRNWLKFLKDRYAWKPSEEQILAIETAINVIGKGTLNGKQLVELQEQLKKLKG